MNGNMADSGQMTTQQQNMPMTNNKSWGDYLKENKMMVLVALAIVAFLVWWFYFRTPSKEGSKEGSGTGSPTSSDAGKGSGYGSGASKMNIKRMRGGN